MRASTKYAIVAIVLILGVLIVLGPAIASRLSVGGGGAPPSQSGTFIIKFKAGTEYDDTGAQPAAGTVTTVSADGASADTYAARADMDDAGAVMKAVFSVINTNNPQFSGQSFQLISHIGTFPTVSNPSTGAAYPLIDPSAADASVADVAWTDADTNGVQTGSQFYDNVAALASETYTAVADVNESAPGAMTIGQVYSVTFVIGSETLTWNLHPSS